MKTDLELLQVAFAAMPKEFTGNEFSKVCQNVGIKQSKIDAGVATQFLHLNARQTTSRKMWIKNSAPKESGDVATDKIEEAIATLKSAGYKVFKPITQFEEI